MIIEFIINTYGKDTFIKWLENPNDFMNQIKEIDNKFNEYIIQKIEVRIK